MAGGGGGGGGAVRCGSVRATGRVGVAHAANALDTKMLVTNAQAFNINRRSVWAGCGRVLRFCVTGRAVPPTFWYKISFQQGI